MRWLGRLIWIRMTLALKARLIYSEGKCRNLRLFPPVTKKNKVIYETVMAQIETEVSKAHVGSSRGKVNPR
ncbi:MAG: hypothetical protein LBP95_02990, partial [Deltaproteobacteria bacterium]|nr:hypothetical protein [Deltaproteobacteria bacterium]